MPQVVYKVTQLLKSGRWNTSGLTYASLNDAELIARSLVEGRSAMAADVLEIGVSGGQIVRRVRRTASGKVETSKK